VTKDAFKPGDVNVTLPAYGVISQTPVGFFDLMLQFLQDIFTKFVKVFTVFFLL
jgi:hypothetical protein